MAHQIISFPDTEQAAPTTVGSKGFSLIRMAQAGLLVPPGVVCTIHFFEPWIGKIRTSSQWMALVEATPERLTTLCAELKAFCSDLSLTDEQRLQLHKRFRTFGEDALFAVRSSSPEEDLPSASFAGAYETQLGVGINDLEDAICYCFASNFDERVLLYKKKHGFNLLSLQFAVIVQKQIKSETSGVAFSISPLTNDYDEAVINANWGLGISVVSGISSPDHFVIDKVGGKVLERKLGAKQVSVWLSPGGGTFEKRDYRSDSYTLTATQLAELTHAIRRIEDLFEKPMDIEWAYADGRFHILQGRPITTYVPLSPEMLTKPGACRQLYADAALSKGLTTNEPISPLSLSYMKEMLYSKVMKQLLGIKGFTPAEGLVFTAGNRFYMNLSNFMWLGMNPRRMAKNAAQTDTLLAEILVNIDPKQYPATRRPPWFRLRLLLAIPRLLWMLRGFFANELWVFLAPERAWRSYQRKVDTVEKDFTFNLNYDLPLEEFARTYTHRLWRLMFNVTMPALIAGLGAIDLTIPKKLKDDKIATGRLSRGFTGNLVVEQGIALFHLAKLLDCSDFDDIKELARRIERSEMPSAFLREWDTFKQRFGCRGPNEMDMASPRYADNPILALRQMSFMAIKEGFDPEAAHRRNIEERRAAYDELLSRSNWLRRIILRHIYRIAELFGGTRDTPKYHAVMLGYAGRKRALMEGERLVHEGRLAEAKEIFGLTFADLREASLEPSLDLHQRSKERTRFAEQLAAPVKEFPQVIDSRGRILRPAPRPGKPGELMGMPVSPGVVTGPVKLLRNAHEKRIEKGEVLVAYATDPGWTPLFVNAAAVVIEVGGMLQHGAVIAREYGKPCVAGIDQVMKKLHDGQHVQVDGTAGIISLLSRMKTEHLEEFSESGNLGHRDRTPSNRN